MRNDSLELMEEILQDYSFEEILQDNDLTLAEAMLFLWEQGYVELPEAPITKPDPTRLGSNGFGADEDYEG